MRKGLLAVSLTAIVSSGILQSVQAQYNSGSQNLCKRESPKNINKDIVLPGISSFPGAKFISGQEATSSERVICAYTIDYSVPKQSQSQIVPWYYKEFSSGGWRINQQTNNSIDASDERTNAHCNIYYDTGDTKSSRLHLNYVVTPKQSP